MVMEKPIPTSSTQAPWLGSLHPIEVDAVNRAVDTAYHTLWPKSQTARMECIEAQRCHI